MIESGSIPVLDAVIVAVYLALTFGFGIFARNLLHSDTKGEEGYYLAGRKMPGWLTGISTAVTAMNSDVAPTYCGMAVVVGLSISWFYLSRFGIALMIAAMLFAVRWRQMGISTGPEFYALRFSGRGAGFVRGYSSIYGVMVGMVPWIGAGMLGVHMIFGPIFGIESKAITLSIILPVLLVYVWISGFAGVLITDLIQTLIILGANIMLALMVLKHFGGPAGLTEAIHAAHPAEANDILSAFPVPGHRVFGPLVVLAWLIVPTIGVGGGVATDGQRIFSCRSLKEAAKVGIWGEIALFAMLLLLTLPALGAIVGHPHLYHADPAERESVYGILLHDYLPTGLLGIALAALLSAVMSTIDSHLNYGSQTLLNDVYRPIFGEPSPGRALWVGRSFMIVILLSAIAVVFFSKSLMGIAVTLSGLFGSSAAFGWGLWWWWRVNRASWFSAIIGGPIIYLALGKGLGHWDWWAAQCAASETSAQSMGMLQAVISMTIGTIVWVAATLATKPEDMAILKRFYKTARPMGLWGPVKEAIVRDEGPEALPPQHRFMILGGMGTAILGFLWVALAVLCLSVLYVGRYGEAAAMAAGAVILALCFKRAFNWHVNRML